MSIYSDIDFSFDMHPTTKDIVVKKDKYAIRQSLINIIKTKYFEIGRDSVFGSNVYNALFKLNTKLSIIQLKDDIVTALNNYEDRIDIHKIFVHDNGQGKYKITIQYYEKNSPELISEEILLEKVR